MRRPVLALVLAGAVGACSDHGDPAAPDPRPNEHAAASLVTTAPIGRADHLTDALERIGAALGKGDEADQVRGALKALLSLPAATADAPGRMRAVEAALDRLERKAPDLAAEADAIRLALATYAADDR